METKDRRPRRLIRVALAVILLLFVAWLVPAAFVALYDPSVPHASSGLDATLDAALGDVLPGAGGHKFFLFRSGYTKSWNVETWEGDVEGTADKHRVAYRVERGRLDRDAGTYEFAVRATLNHAEDVEGMRLYVTESSSWGGAQEGVWTLVEEVRVPEPGAATVSMVCRGTVSASATAYRVEELRGGVVLGGFSTNMLAAPTAFGRAYDAIAWRSAFRWVPKLR